MTKHSASVFGDKSIECEIENKKHRDEENYLNGAPLALPLYQMTPPAGSLASNLFRPFRGTLKIFRRQRVETAPAIAAAVTQHAH
jgi:hypothetical protein